MVPVAPTPLVLRADVSRGDRTSAGYTVEVSPSRLLVRAARVDLPGTNVTVRLSFPRLLEALTLHGTVVATHDPHVHKQTASMSIDLQKDAACDRLATLLGRWQARRMRLPAEGATAAVLIADDNSLIREMFAYGVRKYFYRIGRMVRVETAAHGHAAWQLLCKSAYDLVIVDFELPVLSGQALLGRIRYEPALERLPVVLVSDAGPVARLEALDAGADVFLDKPVVLRDLLGTLEQVTAPLAEPST
jgi:CheY-like chemotaxis protein